MSQFFGSGNVVYLIIAVLLIEVVAFIAMRRKAINIAAAALPGVCLLLALRAALIGESWIWVALWLALSLPAHIVDLWRRPP